jgi:hypothetical protein
VGKLLAAAGKYADDLTIITFNHDLVIENEIFRRAALASRWCLDGCYGSMSADLNQLYPPVGTPKFNLHADGDCSHARPVTLLKLHGSLNWLVRINSRRPTASVLNAGPSASRKLQLVNRRQITGTSVFVRSGSGRTQWNMWPIVVPPVYAKTALRNAMAKAWADARSAVELADRLVVFGYSLPAIDIEAEKLFERAIAQNASLQHIDVINPGHQSAARFAQVGRSMPLHWYPSVDAMLSADDLT